MNTAAALGVRQGDKVSLTTRFGTILTTVQTAADVPEGTVALAPETGLALVEGKAVLKPGSVRLELQR